MFRLGNEMKALEMKAKECVFAALIADISGEQLERVLAMYQLFDTLPGTIQYENLLASISEI